VLEEKHAGATRHVVITGFMGAGKTTVARELARRLPRGAVDLDEFIAARTGRSPRELIDEEGEARFRLIETEALSDALGAGDALVIALGGGAWALERNRALIKDHGCLAVWLDAPFELCWQRLSADGPTRPLAATARAP
jgi:shikimate kinase